MLDYHDATLTLLAIDWKQATATIAFRLCATPSRSVSIVVTELLELHVPHRLPWGPSVFVNRLAVMNPASDEVRLEIEMQSGDLLVVVGRRVVET